MKKNNSYFSIDIFIKKLEEHYRTWNAPIKIFIEKRRDTPFEILIATLLSSRTKDAVTSAASERLFQLAKEPKGMLSLGPNKIKEAIYPVGFYRVKTSRILQICRIILERHGGIVPDNMNALLALPGVGRKTANLVLSEGFNTPSICVDTHVHRVSNRVNYVETSRAEMTEVILRKQLPKVYWNRYNRLIVAFGQIICQPISPLCTECPVEFMCKKTGVKNFR